MRLIDSIWIHCSATSPAVTVNKTWLHRVHVLKNGWSDIGYHWLIKRDAHRVKCRSIKRAGAHTRGYNTTSLGICVAGGVNARGRPQFNYSQLQMQELKLLVDELCDRFGIPYSRVRGHNEVSSKACPSFDVRSWLASKGEPVPARNPLDLEGY